MRAHMSVGILGCFAFDSQGKVIEHRLFPKRPEEIADRLRRSRQGEVLQEESDIVRELIKKGYKEVMWTKDRQVKGIICVQKSEHIGEETMRSTFRKLALDLKWVSSQAELNEIISRVNSLLAKSEMKKEKRDQIIIRVASVLDELDTELNVFSEKLREWYGLHFPEAGPRTPSNERYADIVARHGSRSGVSESELAALAQGSSGMEFSERDIAEVQAFSRDLLRMFEARKRLSAYIEESVSAAMPNTSAVAGPLLAARLLTLAGGLEKMAKLPSSTIQILGAEKALFRHLKGEGKAPKYGVLFGHPLIQSAPKESRGKVARLLSSKISLAARLDNFSDRDEGRKMRQELESQVRKAAKH